MSKTKFIDESGCCKQDTQKTVFTKYFDVDGIFLTAYSNPEDYDTVVHLGNDGDIDFFKAKDEDCKVWTFYIGIKGSEFN